METTNRAGKTSVGELFSFFLDGHPLRSFGAEVPGRVGPKFPVALFISVIPALLPVMGLKVLHFNSSNLGLLFTSMGAGSLSERYSSFRGLECASRPIP